MAGRRRMYADREEPERRWPSVVISLGITAGLFASAFVAMTSLPDWRYRGRPTDAGEQIVIRFVTPRSPAPRDVRPQAPTTTRIDRISQPTPQPQPAAPPLPVAPPTGMPSPSRDSGGPPTAANTVSTRGSATGAALARGAPIAPAGVTQSSRATNTPTVRDSIARAAMADIAELANTREPTGREREQIEKSQRDAILLRGRALTSGNSRDLVILQGKGIDGVGSVAGGQGVIASVPFTLFSQGPSRKQRKKNEQIDAEYQLRLRRLGERALLKRDSLRADSLRRRDSLATARRESLP